MIEFDINLKVRMKLIPKDSTVKLAGFAGHSSIRDPDIDENEDLIQSWPKSDGLRMYVGKSIHPDADYFTIHAELDDYIMPCDLGEQVMQFVKDNSDEIHDQVQKCLLESHDKNNKLIVEEVEEKEIKSTNIDDQYEYTITDKEKISVALCSDDIVTFGGSSIDDKKLMRNCLFEDYTNDIFFSEHSHPRELSNIKRDIVVIDFGGVGEHYGVLVNDYVLKTISLIEDNPNTLFLIYTEYTAYHMKYYIENELKQNYNLNSLINVICVVSNSHESLFMPEHKKNYFKEMQNWFNIDIKKIN